MITFELVKITPLMAETFLSRNFGNRTPKKSTIEGYARDMLDGKWQLTHQAIAFDADNDVIDGQHRLYAVILSGMTIPFYVARYGRKESIANLNIDTQVRRQTDFILGCNTLDQETVRSMLKFHSKKQNPTNAEISDVLGLRGELIHAVTKCFTRTTKYRSSSNSRAAIVLRCFEFPEYAEEILTQYHRFVSLQDMDKLWQSALSLLRCFEATKAMEKTEVFQRVWLAFNPLKRDAKISRISDVPLLNGEIRLVLSRFIDAEVGNA